MGTKGLFAGALAALATAGGGSAAAAPLPHGAEHVALDPADFTTRIDNPYLPLRPGSRWVYRVTDAQGMRQRDVMTVTRRTKLIAVGIRARVVRDVVTEGGRLAEKTDDWYAQDKRGNVWYFGEATREYDRGRPGSTEGSFEAGVDGAEAGVAMAARPRPGLAYRQEYYAGHAEDRGRVISRTELTQAPFGFFRDALMIREHSPTEPRVVEFKFYARGIGQVLAVSTSGESDREELVAFRRGG
jgi:hypothetical protein